MSWASDADRGGPTDPLQACPHAPGCRKAGPSTFSESPLGRLLAVLGNELYIEGQALQFLHEHVEGFRGAGLEEILTLHDRLVDAVASLHVVGLDGEHLLQRVGRAIGLESPPFPLAESLAAELRLASQRLLGDEGVGPDRAGVHLVVDEMGELQHIDLAHRHLLMEWLPCPAIVEVCLAALRVPPLLPLPPGLRPLSPR